MKRISSTLITSLADEKKCPFLINEMYIKKSVRSEPTKAMLMGLFFEQLVLGVKDKVISIPKLKNGNESTDEKRVREQATKILKEVFPQYGIDISKPSSKSFQRFEIEFKEDGFVLVGEFDLLAEINDPDLGRIDAIIDLKLTKNINYENNQENSGKVWSWRYPHNRDHTQAYLYSYIYSILFGKEAKFYYLVSDYKTSPEHLLIRKKFGDMEYRELRQSITDTINKIDDYNANGWPYNPKWENCKNCPLKNVCSKAIKTPPVQEV